MIVMVVLNVKTQTHGIGIAIRRAIEDWEIDQSFSGVLLSLQKLLCERNKGTVILCNKFCALIDD